MPVSLSDAYLRSVARSIHVPEMWVDDCIQEIRIAQWLESAPSPKQLARRRAVDFLRSLMGTTGGSGKHNLQAQPYAFGEMAARVGCTQSTLMDKLPVAVPEIPSEDLLDTRDAMSKLLPRDQRMLGLLARGYTQAEIARLFDISEGRVSECIIRARKLLKGIALPQDGHEPSPYKHGS